MTDNLVITISRQYGTGGREIGHKLALRLGISFLDRELITRAAKKSGFSEELFEQLDKRATNSFLYSLTMFGSTGLNGMSLTDQLYLAQANVIREIAEDAPCVVVGRCADHVLAGTERLVRIFIYADMEARIQRIREKGYYEEHEIARNIRRMDRERRDYHRYYTGKEWENVENYDMMLNSGVLGTDGCVECILSYLKIRGLYPA